MCEWLLWTHWFSHGQYFYYRTSNVLIKPFQQWVFIFVISLRVDPHWSRFLTWKYMQVAFLGEKKKWFEGFFVGLSFLFSLFNGEDRIVLTSPFLPRKKNSWLIFDLWKSKLISLGSHAIRWFLLKSQF